MRSDFKYVPTIPVSEANDKARRRSKKTLLTGAGFATFFGGLWPASLIIFVLLVVTNLVQKKA